jgi:predicted RNA-binding Zn ribbon-like protein
VLGGALCLDFVNTIDPRHEAPREDFLRDHDHLLEWAAYVELVTPEERAQLRLEADSHPGSARAAHRRALALREALYEIFAEAQDPSAGPLELINDELQRALAAMTLVGDRDGGYQRSWDAAPAAERLFGPIMQSALDLLTGPHRRRVRECAGDGCGWLFLDTSKAGRRRWCSMAICGNRAKAQRHRQRRRRRDTRRPRR